MLEAIILGILQGLTEFIPVSSSAHLILIPWFFEWKGIVDTLSFDVALHFGTLIALLVYFRKDWLEIFKSASANRTIILGIILGTFPAAAAGLFLHDWFEHARNPVMIAFTLSLVSVFMILSERNYDRPSRSGLEKITIGKAFFIGLAQACALVPGVSRSGITIIAGLTIGLRREDAARFSFLLGTPAITGASLLEAKNLMNADGLEADIFLLGILVSAVTGYIAIKYLMIFLQKYSLRSFAYYRFLLAFVIIVSIWTGMAG